MRLIIKTHGGLIDEILQDEREELQIIVMDNDVTDDEDNLLIADGEEYYVTFPEARINYQQVDKLFQQLWEE